MNDKKFGSWEEAVNWLVSQPEQQDLVKACYYDRPVLRAAERFWKSDEWESIRTLLPTKTGRALDVGAGNGIASFALAKDGWETTALEPDTSAVVGSNAIKGLSDDAGLDITIVEEFGEKLPFPDKYFDVIHARQVLHHANDLEKFCTELYRVLKPSGTLIATREHVISNAGQLGKFLENHPLHNLYGGENAFTLKTYKLALTSAGFKFSHVFASFDTAINYAPFTENSLCIEIGEKASAVPGGRLMLAFLLAQPWRRFALKFLSKLDNRPGRLYTFVCQREVDSK